MAQRHGNAKVDVAMVSLLPPLVPSITKLLHLPDRIRDMSSARLLLGIRYCVEEKQRFSENPLTNSRPTNHRQEGEAQVLWKLQKVQRKQLQGHEQVIIDRSLAHSQRKCTHSLLRKKKSRQMPLSKNKEASATLGRIHAAIIQLS